MLAPEPYHCACMKVICKAAIYARDQGWRGSVDPMDIADLMDAIHNIPELVQNWERCGRLAVVRRFGISSIK
jgi:hypothetical protein